MARCRAGSANSSIVEPGARRRSSSALAAEPAASGKHAARARGRQRAGPRAARASMAGARIRAPGRSARDPEAAAHALREGTTRGRRTRSSSGRRSPREVGVAEQEPARLGSRLHGESAWPLPRRGGAARSRPALRGLAPCRPRAVVRDDHLGAGKRLRAAPSPVRPIRPSSSRAATRTATGSATGRRRRQRLHRRQDCRRPSFTVAAPDAPAEREPARRRVDVVHGREVAARDGSDGRIGTCHLRATPRTAGP